jgi:type VI secretion system protein VasJ
VVLNGLLATFWVGLVPELRRLRARIAALEWLGGRLEKSLSSRPDPDPADRDALEQAIEGLQRLADDPDRRFGGDTPNLAPAIRALRDKLATIPEPAAPEPAAPESAPPPAAATATASEPAAAAVPPPPPAPEPEPEPDDPASVAEALVAMRERQLAFAAILCAADPTDPRGYLLRREALWHDQQPPLPGGGARAQDGVLAELERDLEAGEYERVLARTEALLGDHPLWLDLQLTTVRALEGLGRRYARARAAVVESLAFLVRRLPQLAQKQKAKDERFASQPTLVWLANEVLTAAASDDANAPATVGSEARKLVARGQLGEAMRLLTQRIDATASRRGRFVLRLDLAQLCIEAGRLELAVPQLEQLEQEVSHFSLEEWEPDLATRVVRSLWQCCVGPTAAPTLADRGKDIYARLCRLDPAAAVSAIGPQGE